MPEFVVLHHTNSNGRWWYVAVAHENSDTTTSYAYDGIPMPNHYKTEAEAADVRDYLEKDSKYSFYTPNLKVESRHESVVTCKLRRRELEQLLIRVVRDASGLEIDRNTLTDCVWGGSMPEDVTVTVVNKLKCGDNNG